MNEIGISRMTARGYLTSVRRIILLSTRDFVELTLRFLRNLFLIYVSPLLNPPLRMGGLAYGLVKRILYRGSSLKFTAFFSSNSRYLRDSNVMLHMT